MAPRRGGGGSSSSGSVPSCSSYAFDSEYSRIQIAFAALYFIVSVALSWIATSRFTKGKKAGEPVAGSIWLGFSILFAAGSYLASIIYMTLFECAPSSANNLIPASLVASWLSASSEFLLTAIILVTLVGKLQREFGRVQPLTLTVLKVWTGLLGALVVTALSLDTARIHYFLHETSSLRESQAEKLAGPGRGVWVAYKVLAVVGILLAISAIVKAGALRATRIKTWTLVLSAAALGYTSTTLGFYIESAFNYTFIRTQSQFDEIHRKSNAASFLHSFFYSVAFYAALRVAGFYAPGSSAQMQATGVEYVQPPVYPQGPVGHGHAQEGRFQNQIPGYEAEQGGYGYPAR